MAGKQNHTIKLSIAQLVLSLLLLTSSAGNAQVISASDSLLLESLKTELKLNNTQQTAIDSIIYSSSAELLDIDKESQRAARSSLPQEEQDRLMTELRERKKSIKESRHLSIRLVLNVDQITLYDDNIKPGKPAVLHMGINHDRANCNVCIPK